MLVFLVYAHIRKVPIELQAQELNLILAKLYAEVRKQNGFPYSRNGLLAVRYGLQTHYQTKGIDIVTDQVFSSANAMLAAILVKLK